MRQSKRKSLEEALMNTVVGFIVGMALNIFVLPVIMDIPPDYMSFEMAASISMIYGGTSVIRSFILRRVYNKVVKRWRIW